MNIKRSGALAAVLMGLGWTFVSGAAYSDSNTVVRYAGMRKVCTEYGGRFERSWLYNDQGARWGEVLSCATNWGSITCQGNVCQGRRWARSNGVNDGALQFPAEAVALADVLAALAGK